MSKSVIKFRLYPNKSQKAKLFAQFAKHCELYNYCLKERVETYKLTGESPSSYEQMSSNIPKFREGINVTSAQQTVRRLDKSFSNFFRRVKAGVKPGFPRFKGRLDSMDFTAGDGAGMRKERFYVQGVGLIKIIKHRELPKYSRISVKYSNGQFFAAFTVEALPKALEPSEKKIGLDFGLKTFITTSDGAKYDSPKFLKQSLSKLQMASRKRDKFEKGTLERRKRNFRVRNICRKVSNQRLDFNHKLANKFIAENGVIVIEDLDTQKLSSGPIRNVNRTYSDVSWGQFTQMLSYKAANAGRKLIRVNPSNTSRTCNKCGKIHNMTVKDRVMDCDCGHKECRDINAAKNILGLGLQSLLIKD